MSNGRIRVLIADDHPLIRRGLASALAHHPRIEVVGEANDGEEAVRQATSLRPDVVLMDVKMPNVDGIEATGEIKATLPETKVVVLTIYDADETVIRSLEAGASAFLLKDASGDEVVDVIEAVHRGESPVEPRVTHVLLERLTNARGQLGSDMGMTEREVEVLRLAATGATNKAIAGALYLSENTVKSHLYHIYDKLEVHGRMQAVTEAARRGIIQI